MHVQQWPHERRACAINHKQTPELQTRPERACGSVRSKSIFRRTRKLLLLSHIAWNADHFKDDSKLKQTYDTSDRHSSGMRMSSSGRHACLRHAVTTSQACSIQTTADSLICSSTNSLSNDSNNDTREQTKYQTP
ncbi:hypothetical protein EVAR_81885_1 [Eumeta japonica]|uniref:Uncharacterized protein n=1 Tax=Eumeta variegata TaxID=151549 RepID=A0A4C1UYA2_EUMVA|nr:hypothetical protein EVAR_81885_1 [Eumeta japonica]